MTAVGGPIESITLAGRIFPVAADADSNRDLGGFKNEYSPNGDGSGRMIKSRVGWSLDGLTVEQDDSRGDAEFLQDLADRNDFFPVGVTYASDETYQGTGQIEGEFMASSQSATAPVALKGPGKLTKQ